MTKSLSAIAFSIGLGIVLWISSRFIGNSAIALLVCATILFVYVVGFIELVRYQQASHSLLEQLNNTKQAPENIEAWLANIPSNLSHAVRKRLAGEPVGLPQPVLSAFLAGLLVMLGLLGTFIGMVETLKGAVTALEASNELEAIRQGLAQPMHGLSMAFGTSIAGVSASAMLGFITSISKRERVQVSRLLDSKIHSVLQPFSLSFQRAQTFTALQQQASSLPDAAQSLSNTSKQLANFSEQMASLLQQQQQSFADSQSAQLAQLSEQLHQGINQHLSQSAELIVNAISPSITQLLSDLNSQNEKSLNTLAQQNQAQLQAFNSLATDNSQQLQSQLEKQNAQSSSQQEKLLENFEQQLQKNLQLLTEQQQANASLQLQSNQEQQQQWLTTSERLAENFAAQANAQQASQEKQIRQLQTQGEQASLQQEKLLGNVEQQLQKSLQQLSEQQQEIASSQLQRNQEQQQQWLSTSESLAENFATQATALQTSQEQQLRQSLQGISQLLEQTEALVNTRIETESNWQESAESRLQQLSAAISEQLSAINQQHQQGFEQSVKALEELQNNAADNLQQLGQTLETPMANLIATASEAPKAAAEVIQQLREEISKNLERDNELLSERQRIMAELNQVSTDMAASAQSQRQAIEQMAGSAEQTLEAVAEKFSLQVASDSELLSAAMEQFKDSALSLAALGQAFEQGIGAFGQSNDILGTQLQDIAQNFNDATSRSDEQMAYYVAQAREIIDHNISAQQQIIEQLRQLPAGQ